VTGTAAPFDSEAGYQAAIDLTLAAAQHELRIFDRDLAHMGLDDRAHIAVLENFFAGGRDRTLRIVLHDTAVLESHLPRLLLLMRQQAANVEVRRTPDHLRHLADCWLLADEAHGAIRFHADHARGKCAIAAPTEVAAWWRRFDDLWQECEVCTPWAVSGL